MRGFKKRYALPGYIRSYYTTLIWNEKGFRAGSLRLTYAGRLMQPICYKSCLRRLFAMALRAHAHTPSLPIQIHNRTTIRKKDTVYSNAGFLPCGYFFASSSSIILLNTSKGWAPLTKRPFIKKEGVPWAPNFWASFESFSTASFISGLSWQA